ncbi:MAG TPA: CRISPR-associated endonuclease Cas1 [bacterium]|nr:CRISPR-associated endonuclease Cas1 [bacterium]
MKSEERKNGNARKGDTLPGADSHLAVLNLIPQLPEQLSLFEEEPDTIDIDLDVVLPEEISFELDEGIAVVQSPEGLSVEVSGYGTRLGKQSGRIVLKSRKGKTLWHIPFDRVQEVFIRSGGVSVSCETLLQCADRGIRVVLAGPDSRPRAVISSPVLSATVEIRRAQLRALENERGLEFARSVCEAKIRNQAYLLRYFSKSADKNDESSSAVRGISDSMLDLRKELRRHKWKSLSKARPAIMGIEGTAARLYWNAVGILLSGHATFDGRSTRGARDFVNACLNYSYGILYGHIWGAVLNAGLEPFAGFLHTDRPGKPSMVLDIIEPFRAPVADRAVISGIRTGHLQPASAANPLGEELRAKLAETVLARLDAKEPFRGGRYMMRSIIQISTRNAAAFLSCRADSFKTFSFKW